MTIAELNAPEVNQNERGYTARWCHVCELPPEYEGSRPRKANVVLSISHHKAGMSYLSGNSHPGYYSASLSNESEEELERGDGTTFTMRETKIDFRTNTGVTLIQEVAPRMSRKRLREVLDAAIAETKRLYAEQDERVVALWQGVGC